MTSILRWPRGGVPEPSAKPDDRLLEFVLIYGSSDAIGGLWRRLRSYGIDITQYADFSITVKCEQPSKKKMKPIGIPTARSRQTEEQATPAEGDELRRINGPLTWMS